jgi:4'-phosphopantetheinyl transferase superfamily protein
MPRVAYSWGEMGTLVLILRDPGLPRLFGRERRLADEAAAAIARRWALVFALPSDGPRSISVSHTEGSAAVLACAGSRMIGVDLVMVERVTRRHAHAILSRDDWSALASVPRALRAPVAWALKEATAKATGAAGKHFPNGIRLLANGARRSPSAHCGNHSFQGDWFVVGQFICATVIGIADPPSVPDQDRCKAIALREWTPILANRCSPWCRAV